MTDQKFSLLLKLLAGSIVLFILGVFIEWQPAAILGVAGVFIFGVVFIFFALPTRLQGKKWWRVMS